MPLQISMQIDSSPSFAGFCLCEDGKYFLFNPLLTPGAGTPRFSLSRRHAESPPEKTGDKERDIEAHVKWFRLSPSWTEVELAVTQADGSFLLLRQRVAVEGKTYTLTILPHGSALMLYGGELICSDGVFKIAAAAAWLPRQIDKPDFDSHEELASKEERTEE